MSKALMQQSANTPRMRDTDNVTANEIPFALPPVKRSELASIRFKVGV